MNLHIQTLFLMNVIVSATMAVALSIATYRHPHLKPWALALVLQVVSFVLYSLRGQVPDEVSIVVANMALTASLALYTVGFLQFQDRPAPHWIVIAPVIVATLHYYLLMDNVPMRLLGGSALILGQNLLHISLQVKFRKKSQGPGWYLLFSGAALVAASMAVRVASIMFGDGASQAVAASSAPQAAGFAAGLIATILISMGMLMMSQERAEAKLAQSELHYRKLVESADEGICVIEGGLIRFANPKACSLMGYPVNELVERNFRELVDPQDQTLVRSHHQQRLQGVADGIIISARLLTRHLGARWFNVSGVAIEWHGRRATLNFLSDVTEARQTREDLQAAKLEAERANDAKSRFLAAASHDLRQPIHALGLFLEVLGRSDLDGNQQGILRNARSVAEASAEMLNTLLDFSKIEAGVVVAQSEPIRLQPLLNKLENELAPQANAKGLYYRTRETNLTVHSDPALLLMILRNLVSNAVRYTDQGGVLVGCRLRRGHAVVEIWDTGIGIDPVQYREIFREFHQLGNTERDHRKGLGLGLAIADGLARTLNHDLSVSSRPGHGSVFRVTLQQSRDAAIGNGLDKHSLHPPTLDLNVLVIDDNEMILIATRQLLKSWGCHCETVETMDAALASAHRHPPDVVISDYRLRGQHSGAEAIAALRLAVGENLPVIVVTGDIAPERVREASAANINLLHKPVSTHELHVLLWKIQALKAKQVTM